MTTERFRLAEQASTQATPDEPRRSTHGRDAAQRAGGGGRLLIIDDERMARANLARALERGGHQSAQAGSGEEGLKLLAEQDIDVVITDIAMAGMNGMEVLKAVRSSKPDVEVIMVTGYPMIESAVEAMRLGAFHYLAKPYSLEEARILVARALEKRRLRQQVVQMRAQLEASGSVPEMVGASPAMGGLRQALMRLAPTDVAVLLQGETGTGKELAARTMHAQSQRARRRFLAINCGALSPELLESELFGHEQGAFSGAVRRKEGLFEAASGGTLFLDEIGEMPAGMQVKLLRVLQEQTLRRVGGTVDIPVDVRIIAATNRNLKEEVEAGRFRRDLYYRIAVVTQELPPLRSRVEDIPMLARFFLARLAEQGGSAPLDIDEAALDALQLYPFPGNVRELANILERAAVFCPPGGSIGLSHLSPEVSEPGLHASTAASAAPAATGLHPSTAASAAPAAPAAMRAGQAEAASAITAASTASAVSGPPVPPGPQASPALPVPSAPQHAHGQDRGQDHGQDHGQDKPLVSLAEMEKQHILRALELAGDNRTLAADMLGISRSSLWRKLREYGV